jgi:hypothetical protein
MWAAVALLLSVSPLWAGDVHVLQTSDMVVYFEPLLESAARDVMRLYPEVRSSLEKTVGWRLRSRPSLMLMGEEKQFRRMAESPLTIAFAVPQKNIMVINHSRVSRDPVRMANTLKHELCHLLLHENIRGESLPRWLDEGVCQWVSDGIPDIVMTQRSSVLNRAALRGRFIPLRSLANGFPLRDQALILAYEQSKSFVSHVIQEHGWDAIQEILGRMRDGLDVSAAFDRTLGMSLEETEQQWQESVKRRTTWFTYLSYYLYEILFALAAILAMVGFVKAVIRKRKMLREYEDEQEIGEAGP